MTTTRCERRGQVEIGIIEHNGNSFAAIGASVVGYQIAAYTKNDRGIRLTTWCGRTILECRHEVEKRPWDGSVVLLFRLTRGRFIVGYALGDDGMLFRGELVVGCTEKVAWQHAMTIAGYFAELDAADEAADSGNH